MTVAPTVIDSSFPAWLYGFISLFAGEALGCSGQVLINTLWIREQLAVGRGGRRRGDTAGAQAVNLEVEIRPREKERAGEKRKTGPAGLNPDRDQDQREVR